MWGLVGWRGGAVSAAGFERCLPPGLGHLFPPARLRRQSPWERRVVLAVERSLRLPHAPPLRLHRPQARVGAAPAAPSRAAPAGDPARRLATSVVVTARMAGAPGVERVDAGTLGSLQLPGQPLTSLSPLPPGTPVNRIPIMAKQVLDLFMLYVLVTEKGGLVEVINKKLWREITKGLNLPTSITSAAFTLRTQYMKYLYPYECEKRGLSNPNELQAAIDSNRREGRRQSFGGSLFAYSPGGAHSMLSSPKLPVSSLGLATNTNGSSITPTPKIKKEEDSAIPITVPGRLPVSLASHPVVAAQAAAVQAAAAQAAVAAQAAALEQLREKLESAEPPEKKIALVADEQQRLMQRALQQNFLAMAAQLPMSIRINSQASESRQDSAVSLTGNSGSNSISMSVEINGIMYTGHALPRPPLSRLHLLGPRHAGKQGMARAFPGQTVKDSCVYSAQKGVIRKHILDVTWDAASPYATLCSQQRWRWQQQHGRPGRKQRDQRWPGRASGSVCALHIYLK
ncbi:hypothetical protein P7K49_032722 [Saguinus oedipus]|uniref:AT-rich interactive domain-containing protein 3 n=1 Tax=Saguinus oedipus TaxID=9490 RepID=A0ABQ9TQN2_SAGOE|nr:hypothetical protein P7K49_032722 [Saguinus oedipus]